MYALLGTPLAGAQKRSCWNFEKLHWDGESGATSPKPPFFYLLRHKIPIWTVWGLLGGLEPKHASPAISLHIPNFTPFHCTCQMLPVMNTPNRPDCKSVICPERYEREGGWLKVWWPNKSINSYCSGLTLRRFTKWIFWTCELHFRNRYEPPLSYVELYSWVRESESY